MIPSEQIAIFEYLPGFHFKVRFINNFTMEKFTTEVMEDVEYNLKFNKNATFTFDNFSSFILSNDLEERVKRLVIDTYVLDFTIFNSMVLKNSKFEENFREGFICTSVSNSSGKLNPELYQRFCDEAGIAYLRPLYEGVRTMENYANLMNMSKFATDGRCYGIILRGSYDNYEEIILAESDDYVQSTMIDRAEELLQELVGMKASSDFIMNALDRAGIPLTNVTRVYNTITNSIIMEPEFLEYKDEILKTRNSQWLNRELRTQVKKKFKNILSEIRRGRGLE